VSLDRSLQAIVRRDRTITVAALAVLALLAWLYLARLHGEMAEMAGMGMATAPWTVHDAVMAAVMWTVMMTAMMVPSAAPMIVMFTTMNRRRREEGGGAHVNTALFVAGYLLTWCGFSVVAAGAQWALTNAALMAPDAMRLGPRAAAGVLIVAALYQVTPFKYACLARCQSPFGFLMAEWRDGDAGAFRMGVRHGLFCLGCCWALMALLFVSGVMSLPWVAALAAFVLLEKLVAHRAVSWVSAALMVAAAVWLIGAR
jgi:predicted metal-binding membrane protein